ncbi:MAG: ribonuclease Y [Deltaproteobacteria bacterium]|nr:ribonuclease Y [Deltaproteobacteria bacterium]
MHLSFGVYFLLILFLGIGGLIGFLIRKKFVESKIEISENKALEIIKDAKKEAITIKKEVSLQAKEKLYQERLEFERENRGRRTELQSFEKRLVQKEENLEKKVNLLEQKEINISKREKSVVNQEKIVLEKEKKYHELLEKNQKELEKLSGISSEEARRLLIQSMENEAKHEAAKMIKKIDEETREKADRIAKDIISLAIQRYSAEYVAEKTVSVVSLPNDEMKGRIIGREGRNIRAIEAATGIDVIIDDTPEAVLLSGFDPIRREVARISLERLISDGRIHPTRIEEIVEKVQQEMEIKIREAGEQAAFDVGVHRLHPEMIKHMGKLKYRTSFDQNVLQHSIEVSFLCGALAGELGFDVKQAKRTGFLHDIGKAVDYEVEGTHALIGAELSRKYNESQEVVHAIAAHHDDEKPQTVLAVLVQAADALSAARPGARREMLETYIKHLKELEEIASSNDGVTKSYAIQAGREIRVIVDSKEISDEDAVMLSRDIAKKIESTLTYPGQIKVTVIRETRAIQLAK